MNSAETSLGEMPENVRAALSHPHEYEPFGFVRDSDGGLVPTDWCRYCWQSNGVYISRPMNGHLVRVPPEGTAA